jgi:hypothetical protein
MIGPWEGAGGGQARELRWSRTTQKSESNAQAGAPPVPLVTLCKFPLLLLLLLLLLPPPPPPPPPPAHLLPENAALRHAPRELEGVADVFVGGAIVIHDGTVHEVGNTVDEYHHVLLRTITSRLENHLPLQEHITLEEHIALKETPRPSGTPGLLKKSWPLRNT